MRFRCSCLWLAGRPQSPSTHCCLSWREYEPCLCGGNERWTCCRCQRRIACRRVRSSHNSIIARSGTSIATTTTTSTLFLRVFTERKNWYQVTVFPRVVPWFRVLAHGSLQCFPQLSDSVIAHTTTVRGFVLLCMHKSSVYIDTGCAQQQYKRRCCICEKSIYVLSSSAVLVL